MFLKIRVHIPGGIYRGGCYYEQVDTILIRFEPSRPSLCLACTLKYPSHNAFFL